MRSERSTTTPTTEPAAAIPSEGSARAQLGGVMKIDDDRFRIGVLAIDRSGPRAALQILHRDDRSLNRIVEVGVGARFSVGRHRVRVVTVRDAAVAVRWSSSEAGSE